MLYKGSCFEGKCYDIVEKSGLVKITIEFASKDKELKMVILDFFDKILQREQ